MLFDSPARAPFARWRNSKVVIDATSSPARMAAWYPGVLDIKVPLRVSRHDPTDRYALQEP